MPSDILTVAEIKLRAGLSNANNRNDTRFDDYLDQILTANTTQAVKQIHGLGR